MALGTNRDYKTRITRAKRSLKIHSEYMKLGMSSGEAFEKVKILNDRQLKNEYDKLKSIW